MFGAQIETIFGDLYGHFKGPGMFLLLYLTAIVAGNIPSHFKHKNNPRYSAVGASGATSAIVLVACLIDPWNWFIYPPVPAIIFAIGYLFYSSWADKTNKADGIGHSAHLFGALWGIVFFLFTKPEMINHFLTMLQQPRGPSWF